MVIWITGLSGSGKSTLANHLKAEFDKIDLNSFILDGDVLREGLNSDLGFSAEDRCENIRRAAEVASVLVDAGLIVITAFISPFQIDRERAKSIIGSDAFVEVYLDVSLEVCEQRDVKGLYKKARAGNIKNFTGMHQPYEPPLKPDIIVNTSDLTIEESVKAIIEYLNKIKFTNFK